MSDAARWREPIGAFQLGVPVSTKAEMLHHHLRLRSVMRWRTAQLPRQNRWRKTMQHYVALLSDKVQASAAIRSRFRQRLMATFRCRGSTAASTAVRSPAAAARA